MSARPWQRVSLFRWQAAGPSELSRLSVYSEDPVSGCGRSGPGAATDVGFEGLAYEQVAQLTALLPWGGSSALFFTGDMMTPTKAAEIALDARQCPFQTVVFTKVDGWPCATLAPSPYEVQFERGEGFISKNVRSASQKNEVALSSLIPEMFWRGSGAGAWNCRHLLAPAFGAPRAALVRLHKPWLNASIGQRTPIVTALKYRYQIDIGGSSCTTWDALRWKLASGRLVFRVMLPATDWFHQFIAPWTHYVPVSADLSDLEERFAWAEAHPNAAQQIAQRGAAIGKHTAPKNASASLIAALNHARVTASTLPLERIFPHCHFGPCCHGHGHGHRRGHGHGHGHGHG